MMVANDLKPGSPVEWSAPTGEIHSGVIVSSAPWRLGRWAQDSADGSLWGITRTRTGYFITEHSPERVSGATRQLSGWYEQERPSIGYNHDRAVRDALNGMTLVRAC